MAQVASPTIVFTRLAKEVYSPHVKALQEEMREHRLKSFGIVTIRRAPNEEGEFNFKTLNNTLHRASCHMGYYLTTPVIVNFNNTLTKDEIMECISEIRMADVGRVYVVEMALDGTYTTDLLINQNVEFKTFDNIELQTKSKAERM